MAASDQFTATKNSDAVLIRDPRGRDELRYIFGKMPDGERGPAVPGTAFTHPLWTPSGEVVTDVGAVDHPHHRGVFCAWINVAGIQRGDWWGWGARAPKEGRAIVGRSAEIVSAGKSDAVLKIVNAWQADGQDVLIEHVSIRTSQSVGYNVADYIYHFVPATDQPVVLAQNPFGGFCYRANPRGPITISGPSGPMDREDSWQDSYERNWSASPWYDFSTTRDGKAVGAAVMDHPSNPPSTWHIIRPAHMVNPCIVAPGEIAIAAGIGLTLRYRVAAHDGLPDDKLLDKLYDDFARS